MQTIFLGHWTQIFGVVGMSILVFTFFVLTLTFIFVKDLQNWQAVFFLSLLTLFFGYHVTKGLFGTYSITVNEDGSKTLRNCLRIPVGKIEKDEKVTIEYLSRQIKQGPMPFAILHTPKKSYRTVESLSIRKLDAIFKN